MKRERSTASPDRHPRTPVAARTSDGPTRRAYLLPALGALALPALLAVAGCRSEGDPGPQVVSTDDPRAVYMCPPCHVHEDLFLDADGVCPVCGMALIERPDSSQVGRIHIHPGSGNFLLEGGPGHPEKLIQVFYHRPEGFTSRSPFVVVVPGAGRDADEYRDAWIDASERSGVLVLSPRYRESEYGFGAYHMGGLMEELNLSESVLREEGSNRAHLDEDRFDYRVNPDREEWIFNDFDRLFVGVARAVGSDRESYDLFGHSAGGQILHRLVLFYPESRADRILAGNAGFFTLPDTALDLPFGIGNTTVTEEDLERSLGRRLVLFLGEEDDETETGGTLLRSPTVDRQGLHRLERGRSFYAAGRALAERRSVPFAWELEVVPDVGHDFAAMSRAAAEYLYGDSRAEEGS